MKINKVNILCTKVDLKKNGKGEAYLAIDFLDIDSGDSFNLISKDIELMSKLKQMNKYTAGFSLTSSKYGLRLELLDIGSSLGTI